jgi:hypothetical protein
MSYSRTVSCPLARSPARLISCAWLVLIMALGCGGRPGRVEFCLEDSQAGMDFSALALWFAPILYLNPDEPAEILGVIPVFHPSRTVVAYHVFLDDDTMLAGRGKELDHEVIWVEYDPVTLKVSDVLTLWHRTVLRTDACVLDAQLPGQRPRVCVQWGQHGMLPFGWQGLLTGRPRLELLVHYGLARYINRVPMASPTEPAIVFEGSYEDYVTFTRPVDTLEYVKKQDVVVAEYCDQELHSRFDKSFSMKKQWPDW